MTEKATIIAAEHPSLRARPLIPENPLPATLRPVQSAAENGHFSRIPILYIHIQIFPTGKMAWYRRNL
jgi:hypothetical protein